MKINWNLSEISNRRSGAFFIKRKFDDDKLYKSVFNEYVTTVLEKGYNVEFFIGNSIAGVTGNWLFCCLEGGRSRTGKLMRPRLGLINVIVDGVLSNRLKDAILVPISIGFYFYYFYYFIFYFYYFYFILFYFYYFYFLLFLFYFLFYCLVNYFYCFYFFILFLWYFITFYLLFIFINFIFCFNLYNKNIKIW